jgi:hypothetical protein
MSEKVAKIGSPMECINSEDTKINIKNIFINVPFNGIETPFYENILNIIFSDETLSEALRKNSSNIHYILSNIARFIPKYS